MSSEAVGLDESTLDVDDDPADCLDIVDGATMTAGKSIGPLSDEDDEFDLSEGLLGVDQAILQSIDKCGKFGNILTSYIIIFKHCVNSNVKSIYLFFHCFNTPNNNCLSIFILIEASTYTTLRHTTIIDHK